MAIVGAKSLRPDPPSRQLSSIPKQVGRYSHCCCSNDLGRLTGRAVPGMTAEGQEQVGVGEELCTENKTFR